MSSLSEKEQLKLDVDKVTICLRLRTVCVAFHVRETERGLMNGRCVCSQQSSGESGRGSSSYYSMLRQDVLGSVMQLFVLCWLFT